MHADRARAVSRAAARSALVLAVAALSACFEEPVDERLTLCFLADGTVIVTARTRIGDVPGAESNPALARRLAEARRALADGDDAWARRFRDLDAIAERRVLDLEGGEVREARRSAAGIEAEGLRRFFAGSGVAASYQRGDESAELVLSAGPSTRATEAQRRKVAEALTSWSELLARYAADTAALYAYLGAHPERAQPCFSVLFSRVTRERGADLGERESELVDVVSRDIDEAVKVFEVSEDEMYSLNELSHLVFDPFPARIEVRLGAPAAEVEGFRARPDGAYEVAGLGLWEAVEALEGRWLSPDPLLAFVRASRDRHQPFALATFAALPRRAETPPDAASVRKEIQRRLAPEPVYRLTWPSPAKPADDGSPAFDWDAVRCP